MPVCNMWFSCKPGVTHLIKLLRLKKYVDILSARPCYMVPVCRGSQGQISNNDFKKYCHSNIFISRSNSLSEEYVADINIKVI